MNIRGQRLLLTACSEAAAGGLDTDSRALDNLVLSLSGFGSGNSGSLSDGLLLDHILMDDLDPLSLHELLLLGLLNAALLRGGHVGHGRDIEDANPLRLDLVGECDEVRDLDLDERAVDLVHNLAALAIDDEGLGDVLLGDDLAVGALLEHVELLRAANTAAERVDGALMDVLVCGRMGNAEGAVNTMAVLNSDTAAMVPVLVAGVAEVRRTEAVVEGD